MEKNKPTSASSQTFVESTIITEKALVWEARFGASVADTMPLIDFAIQYMFILVGTCLWS
jgi:hypothetical protein